MLRMWVGLLVTTVKLVSSEPGLMTSQTQGLESGRVVPRRSRLRFNALLIKYILYVSGKSNKKFAVKLSRTEIHKVRRSATVHQVHPLVIHRKLLFMKDIGSDM